MTYTFNMMLANLFCHSCVPNAIYPALVIASAIMNGFNTSINMSNNAQENILRYPTSGKKVTHSLLNPISNAEHFSFIKICKTSDLASHIMDNGVH